MLPRKYRKMPLDLADFRKRFGWQDYHILGLLGDTRPTALRLTSIPHRIFGTPSDTVRLYARKYIDWFRAHPEKVHLFPLKGMVFQYWFARGIRDGMGTKVALRTIAVDAEGKVPQAVVNKQAEKMGFKGKPIVLHDHVVLERATGQIQLATQSHIEMHDVGLPADTASGIVPLHGKSREIFPGDLAGKRVNLKGRSVVNVKPEKSGLAPKERAFVKRALYAAGVALAREILRAEKGLE